MGNQVDPRGVRTNVDLTALGRAQDEMAEQSANPAPIVLDLVEYYPSTRGEDVKHKAQAIYGGVVERASDGFTVLRLTSPSASRAHQIEVGSVYAITLNGRRHVLQTSWGRYRVRAQEIRRIIEGEVEEWARPYFDPASEKWFKRAPDYEDQTDPDAERKHSRLVLGEPVARGRSSRTQTQAAPPAGCAVVMVGALALFVGGMLMVTHGA
jgi:hypothetical protein